MQRLSMRLHLLVSAQCVSPNPFLGGYGASDLTGLNNKFEYENNTLKFLFAAPFFDSEERTLYSYQLEGFDENWSAWSRNTEKEYTGLWEGDYVFSR